MDTSNGAAALSIRNVSKAFGAQRVLDGVDLDVGSAELVAFIGLNGAGKTTLFKSVLDLCAIAAGEIRIFGEPHRRRAARAQLMYLPERFVPPYFMTGYEFLDFACALSKRGVQRDEMDAAANEVELEPVALGRMVRDYSSGMTRKVGLAACLLSRRPLLLLDEPLSGLDPLARSQFKKALLKLKTAGRGVFFSSHDLAGVADVCDRVALLHKGRIQFAGSPDECLAVYHGTSLETAFLHAIEGEQ